jgi:hypothetical protein
VKPAGVSGLERGNICKTKLMNLQRTVIVRILEIYRGIYEFKRGIQSRSTLGRMRMVICLEIPTTFLKAGGTTSLSYRMYIGSVMLDR